MIHRVFKKRFVFTGHLILKTGMHIGGGEMGFSTSDNPVVRTADGQPYIPGSSLKGAFRSTVEKLAATVGLHSCGLMAGAGCPGAQGDEQVGFNALRERSRWNDRQVVDALSEGTTIRCSSDGQSREQEVRLCTTCWLFGSPYTASKISFRDLYLIEAMDGVVQVRDGVAIDRDSETQVPGLLYNYEVVSPTLVFGMEILLEDPSDMDLQLTCLGLSEFLNGFGSVGGKRSRGLGRCDLTDLKVHELDLTDESQRATRLRNYLLGTTLEQKMPPRANATAFVNQQIEALLA